MRAEALDVIRQGEKKPTRYHIGEDCAITLNGGPAELNDLRRDDTVKVTHQSLDRLNPKATSIVARRASDRTRWAMVIGIQDYDPSLSRLEYPIADAKLLRDTLISRYQVPDSQVSLLTDESLIRLQQSIPQWLGGIPGDAILLVFFTGHAYKNEDGKVYLAPKTFDLKRISATGLPLQWLVDELEQCPAKDKLLLLDCSHAGKGADLAQQPSTAEMLRSLKTPPGRSPLRTITAIASCRDGQRGLDWPEKRHGLFAWLLARGYAGDADKNRDNRLEPTELFGYLQEEMANAGRELHVSQTPELILPDNRPPRLSEEAKIAIRKLAAHLRRSNVNLPGAESDYTIAVMAAGNEIEPKLLYGLLLMKDKQRDAAVRQFEAIKSQYTDLLLPLQAIAWVSFERRAYPTGINELAELVSKIPKPKESYSEAQQQIFYWAGQLREFVALVDERRSSTTTLDEAIARHSADAQRLYEEGRAKSRAIQADFERQIATAPSAARASTLKIEARQVIRYTDFSYDEATQQILAGLAQ